jgi:chaperonin GroES
MIEALFNAVVVQPIELEETTYGNIVVPDLGNEKNKTAKVISVGPGAQSITGDFLSTTLKPGDIVILPTMTFTRFEYKGEEYMIGRENDILAKIIKE